MWQHTNVYRLSTVSLRGVGGAFALFGNFFDNESIQVFFKSSRLSDAIAKNNASFISQLVYICALNTHSEMASDSISELRIFLGGMPPDPPSISMLCMLIVLHNGTEQIPRSPNFP